MFKNYYFYCLIEQKNKDKVKCYYICGIGNNNHSNHVCHKWKSLLSFISPFAS